jgi:hypothetical protein
MTHLLFAVEWDTRGGDGGVAGRHGKPGEGGPGGQGGEPCEWYEQLALRFLNVELMNSREEHLGYNFTCTPECVGIGREHRSNTRRMLEWGRPSREL